MSERTGLFPVFLDLKGERVVVVGGGEVAERKVCSLIDCGARVTVIAPKVTPGIAALVSGGDVTREARAYRTGDLDGATIAFVAVDDPGASARMAGDARAARVPVNVVDRPGVCDFIVPSVLRRGHLAVAISTSGASPAWARRLRKRLEGEIGPEWERLMDALASVRGRLMEEMPDAGERRAALMRLADDACLGLARELEGAELEEALLGVAREGSAKG
ncbi:MAG: precorrin-2 dehydrogenase/sirohydrochlorin ferrochelatase family protein [Planctomycetota bacterium]|jgi:precorrin-2 dehydrogenase/sirohydrochlorin ferrochelatase